MLEPVWGYLKNKVHAHNPKNKDELWEWVKFEWARIPTSYVRKLCYDDYYKRLEAVIAAKGGVTKY